MQGRSKLTFCFLIYRITQPFKLKVSNYESDELLRYHTNDFHAFEYFVLSYQLTILELFGKYPFLTNATINLKVFSIL